MPRHGAAAGAAGQRQWLPRSVLVLGIAGCSVFLVVVYGVTGYRLQGVSLSSIIGSLSDQTKPEAEWAGGAPPAMLQGLSILDADTMEDESDGKGGLIPKTMAATTTEAPPTSTARRRSIFEQWGEGNEWLPQLAAVQGDCALPAEDVPMSPGGGFASKFQLVAAKAMKALRAGKAFRLVGHFAGYTATKHCEEVVGSSLYKAKGSYTCFFQPERSCEDGSRGEGDGQSQAALKKFAHLSREQEAEVYQALEAYLFRLNFDTVTEFEKRHALVGFDEEATDCLVGVHARRGDKVVDAYNRYYTSKEYAQTIFTWASQADRCKSSETTCTVYVASDSSVVMPEIKGYLEPVSAGACRFRVIGNERSVTQKAMDSHRFDKVDEIQGMAGKVQLLRGDEAKQATLDILFDIYMLSRSNFVVGTLTSQIGRIATGLKNAVKYAPAAGSPPVALDYSNWRAVEGMGGGDGIPTPLAEKWVAPQSDDLSMDRAPGAKREPSPVDPGFQPLLDAVLALQADCGRPSERVPLGEPAGGELAALLRHAAEAAAAAFRQGRRVVFTGHLNGYSQLDVCKERVGGQRFASAGSFTCFFLPESTCEAGTAAEVATAAAAEEALKKADDESILLGVVAAWMTRLTEESKAELMKREWISRIKDAPSPLIAVQISGEKATGGPGPPVSKYAEAVRSWAASPAAKPPWGARVGTCTVFVASDGNEAVVDLRKMLHDKEAGQCHFTVHGLQEYWAHHHYKDGWPGKLNNADGRWATRDILFDLGVLSRADILVASAASPMARLAALIRRASRGQVALDSRVMALDLDARGQELADFERPLWTRPPAP